jgi:antitoxin ParD1/3/4
MLAKSRPIDDIGIMPTHNISLTEQQERFVDRAVASGQYLDASEVLRDGLRLLEQRQAENAAKLARLLAAVDEAYADYARGDYVEVPDDKLGEWLTSLRQTRRT